MDETEKLNKMIDRLMITQGIVPDKLYISRIDFEALDRELMRFPSFICKSSGQYRYRGIPLEIMESSNPPPETL